MYPPDHEWQWNYDTVNYCWNTINISFGPWIKLNDDDDNSNSVPDLQDSGAIQGEDDLVQLTATVTLHDDSGGTLKVSWPSDVSKRVKVWTSTNRTTEASNPTSIPNIPTGTTTTNFWIEGTNASQVFGDVGFTAKYGAHCKTATGAVVKVALEELTFSGTKYHTVKSDDGTTDYTGPQWQDPDRDGNAADGHSWPLCFTRNTKMIVAGKWYMEPTNLAVTIKIKGDGPGNLDFPETMATISGNDITLTNAECSNPFTNQVDIFDPMSIDWKVSFDSGSTWCNAGNNTNQCYVTLGDPLTTVYQTLVHLGCKNADGQSNADETADSIYTEFTDRIVCRVSDNEQMTYWAQGNDPGATETGDILQRADANGNCQAWSALFRDFLRVQGITADRIKASPVSPDLSILVKNWKFGKHVRTGANGLRDTDLAGDDVALFAKDNGSPNTVCVEAGVNLITATAGDDAIAGNNINTGPDGICNTASSGNDVQ